MTGPVAVYASVGSFVERYWIVDSGKCRASMSPAIVTVRLEAICICKWLYESVAVLFTLRYIIL